MKENKTEKISFDRKEAASRLGISVVTLDRELARNKISHFRIGRRVLFTDDHLKSYVEANTKNAK